MHSTYRIVMLILIAIFPLMAIEAQDQAADSMQKSQIRYFLPR